MNIYTVWPKIKNTNKLNKSGYLDSNKQICKIIRMNHYSSNKYVSCMLYICQQFLLRCVNWETSPCPFPRIKMPRFTRLNLRDIGHHRVLTSTPLKAFGMCWSTLHCLSKKKSCTLIFHWTVFSFDYIVHSLWQCFDNVMQHHNIYFHQELH